MHTVGQLDFYGATDLKIRPVGWDTTDCGLALLRSLDQKANEFFDKEINNNIKDLIYR